MARIHPLACVDGGAVIADDAEIGPFSVVGPHVRIGSGCRLIANVHITGHTTLGDRTVVYPYASLGSPPQSTKYRGGATQLIIGADCEIRENVTMNPGTEDGGGVTRVGDRGVFMGGAHIGHDCQIGEGVIFANIAMLGGHCEIGAGVIMGAMTGAHQFTRIGEGAMIGAVTGVRSDVIPFGMAVGDTARLTGLNVVGLRRQGIPASTLAAARRAFRRLFFSAEPLAARLDAIDAEFGDNPTVMKITAFVRAGAKRPLCRPGRGVTGDAS
jgi:UDP-N-acetylglucosamine acyltransferase